MFRFLIITLVGCTFITNCNADCIWYGVCYPEEIEDGGKAFNCAVNRTGRPITDENAQKTMLRLCPELFTNGKQCIWSENRFSLTEVVIHFCFNSYSYQTGIAVL